MPDGWSLNIRKKCIECLSYPVNYPADVVDLYPSIPHEAGLKALREVLDKREQHSVPTSELISMADFVLKNNYFEFNGQIK